MTMQARFGPNVRSLTVEFEARDVPGSVSIGQMLAGLYCQACVIEITQAFDGGTTITVGDLVAQGRFQAAADNTPGVEAVYETQPNYAYVVTTEVFVFLTGTPTVGQGRVILYF